MPIMKSDFALSVFKTFKYLFLTILPIAVIYSKVFIFPAIISWILGSCELDFHGNFVQCHNPISFLSPVDPASEKCQWLLREHSCA